MWLFFFSLECFQHMIDKQGDYKSKLKNISANLLFNINNRLG